MLISSIYFIKLCFPVFNLLLFIGKYFIVYLGNITIPININIIPHCSFQVHYNLFDDKVIIDKISFYNRKIYIAPFAVPLFKGKIKRLYLSTQSGFIAINDLNIYKIKQSPVDIEINNINLYEILGDPKYKNSYINGKVSLKIDDKKINCQVKDFIVKNINVNDISIGSAHLNAYYESTDIKKNINCNIKYLTINNLKINDNIVGNIHFNGYYNSTDLKKNVNCSIKDLTINNLKINNNIVGNIHFNGLCKSNDIKQNINCQAKDLIIDNIRMNNNSIKRVHFNGYCESNNISKNIDCKVNELIFNNVKLNNYNIGDVKFNGSYENNIIDCKLDFPNIKHNLSCNGKVILNKNTEFDLLLKSNTPLIISNLQIKDNISLSTKCEYIGKWKYSNNNNIMDLNIKTFDNKIKNVTLGNIALQGIYKNNKLQCKLDLNKWKHIINCNGTLNYGKKLKYNLNINSNTPLVLNNNNISIKLPININTTYDLNVHNSNNNIDISGNVKLYNSSIAQYLDNINANININKNILNINTLSANIPSFIHGKLEVNGNIDLNNKSNFNTKCNIKLINGVITNLPVVKGTIDANLDLTGSIINDPLLKGDIIIRNPKANLAPVLNGALLSTQIIEKFIKKKKTKQNNNEVILSPINTDINVKIDKVLEANGPGLETTWNGGATIQCKKGSPINWDAKLSLVAGKYIIAKKKLKLTSGECISNPKIKGLFTLMIAGRKKSNNDVVELKFIQKQNNTQIEFFSQPMKSKQDILALLLFDKYNSELTSSEAYTLGITIQSLISGKGNIFSKINDTVNIELKDNTNTNSGDEYKSISIGKKIGKWKVNLERGRENDSTKISAERKILKSIKANIGVSKENGMEAGLVWSKRY